MQQIKITHNNKFNKEFTPISSATSPMRSSQIDLALWDYGLNSFTSSILNSKRLLTEPMGLEKPYASLSWLSTMCRKI